MNKRITVITVISAILAAMGAIVMFLPMVNVTQQYFFFTLMTIAPLLLMVIICYCVTLSRLKAFKKSIAQTLILSCPAIPTAEQKKQAFIKLCRTPVIVFGVFALAFGIYLAVNGIQFIPMFMWIGTLIMVVALYLYVSTVTYYVNGGEGKMVLCHSYFALFGVGYRLNGYDKAIYKVELDNDRLTIGLTVKGNDTQYTFPLPEDQLPKAQAFIKDLEEHFERMDQQADEQVVSDDNL